MHWAISQAKMSLPKKTQARSAWTQSKNPRTSSARVRQRLKSIVGIGGNHFSDLEKMPRPSLSSESWFLSPRWFRPCGVKGSSAHANPNHMYTQSPFEALKITCARSWGSHVHTSEPTITCTHKWDHLRTQIQITCAHKYSATAITCTHHYSYTLIKRHYSYTLIKSHETFRVYRLLHLMQEEPRLL